MQFIKALVPMALGLATLAVSSSPLAARQAATTTKCRSFKLIAEIAEPSTEDSSQRIFGCSVDGRVVTGLHTGAGRQESVLSDKEGLAFFANSTGNTPGAGIVAARGNPFPTAMQLTVVGNIRAPAGELVYISAINGGFGRPGLSVNSEGYLEVGPPMAGKGGKWLVFHEKVPVPGRPDFQLRYVEPLVQDQLPEGSVAIALRAQCAGELPPLPANAVYNYDNVEEVVGFENAEDKP